MRTRLHLLGENHERVGQAHRVGALGQLALERRVDEEISIGDFVLSGGELAAMALIDACVRQLPGALGDGASAVEESFADGLHPSVRDDFIECFEEKRREDSYES